MKVCPICPRPMATRSTSASRTGLRSSRLVTRRQVLWLRWPQRNCPDRVRCAGPPPWARPGGEMDPTELPTSPWIRPRRSGAYASRAAASAGRDTRRDGPGAPRSGTRARDSCTAGRPGLDPRQPDPHSAGRLGEVTEEMPTEQVEPPSCHAACGGARPGHRVGGPSRAHPVRG